MKKLNILILLSVFTSTSLIIPKAETTVLDNIPYKNGDSDSTKKTKEVFIKINHNFNFAYKAFRYYNPEIDTQTVMQFIKVCEFYNFDTTQTIFRMFVGQILIESGSKHYKNGNVNIGSGGHIGIAQISPKSGLAIMTKLVTNNDIEVFKYLTDDTTLIKPITYSQSINWLSNKNNNLTFWGYMMNKNMKSGLVENALVKYNAGLGGYQNYVNSGNKVSNHHYITGIKNKLAKIN